MYFQLFFKSQILELIEVEHAVKHAKWHADLKYLRNHCFRSFTNQLSGDM